MESDEEMPDDVDASDFATAEPETEVQLRARLFEMAFLGKPELAEKVEAGDVDPRLVISLETPACFCQERFESCGQEEGMPDDILDDIVKSLWRGCCSCTQDNMEEKLQKSSVTLLHVAVSQGHEHLSRTLHKHGADINARTETFCLTPLHLSVHCSVQPKVEWIKFMLDSGADINARDAYENTALHFAVDRNYSDIVELLGGSPDNTSKEVVNMDGETALYQAVQIGYTECVRVLVEKGANTNFKNEAGWIPLILAARHGRTEIVKLLLKGNCDVNLSGPGRHRDTALHSAAYQDNVELTRLLLEAGALPDVQSDGGHTPLMGAAYSNFPEVAKLLLQHNCSVNMCNSHGYSALHLAAWDGHMTIVNMLLEAGAKHDEQTDDKNTPLALACHGNHFEIVQRLLPLGCNVNNADKDLDTPIHYAAYNGCLKTVTLLAEHNANPDVENAHNATPLWNAVQRKHRSVMEFLLYKNVRLDISSRGVDQHAHTSHVVLLYLEPKTPFMVACEQGGFDIAKILLYAGTDMKKECWFWNRNYPQRLVDNEQVASWLYEHATTPATLKCLSRTFVRRRLGLNIEQVKNLEIPSTLRDYLLLKYL